MTVGRLVTPAELRAYLGVTRSSFARLRAAGVIPAPLPGSRRYDLEACKLALDNRENHALNQPQSTEDRLIQRARQWRKSA